MKSEGSDVCSDGRVPSTAFDPINDIQAISLIGATGLLFTVHPSLPLNNIQELVNYSRSNPNKVSFATVGPGSNVHLALELFKPKELKPAQTACTRFLKTPSGDEAVVA